jgi:hypothetical protein
MLVSDINVPSAFMFSKCLRYLGHVNDRVLTGLRGILSNMIELSSLRTDLHIIHITSAGRECHNRPFVCFHAFYPVATKERQ